MISFAWNTHEIIAFFNMWMQEQICSTCDLLNLENKRWQTRYKRDWRYHLHNSCTSLRHIKQLYYLLLALLLISASPTEVSLPTLTPPLFWYVSFPPLLICTLLCLHAEEHAYEWKVKHA